MLDVSGVDTHDRVAFPPIKGDALVGFPETDFLPGDPGRAEAGRSSRLAQIEEVAPDVLAKGGALWGVDQLRGSVVVGVTHALKMLAKGRAILLDG